MKVNISVDDNLMQQIDTFADTHFTTRSGFFTQAAVNLLLQYEVKDSISAMSAAMQRIADTGEVSDETLKKLDDFNRLCTMFSEAF